MMLPNPPVQEVTRKLIEKNYVHVQEKMIKGKLEIKSTKVNQKPYRINSSHM